MTAREETEPQDRDDPLEEAVLGFTYRIAGGEAVDLDAYVAGVPEAMRTELRQRCRQALRVQEALRLAASPAPGGDVPPPGTGIFKRIGDYEPESEIGRGSMGVVFLARHVPSGREVALKVLAFHLGVSARAVQRFRREMTAASKLAHPGIVEIHEVGEDRGLLFIAMEYVDGVSLEELLQRAAATKATGGDGDLPLPCIDGSRISRIGRVCEVVAGVAEALHHAHQRGIIHRDVKPANIRIDRSGRPRLLDFGLAKDLSELSISGTGDLAGTPCYMSPEQAMSKRVQIDHRTDVFSLGVVFYEMLAQRRPFGGETLQRLFFEITFKEPEPLRRLRPDLPRDAITICEKAMSKNPEHRFRDAGDMAQDLRRFLNHESILARPVGVLQRWMRRVRTHPVATGISIAAVLALALSPVFLLWWGRRVRLAQSLESARPFLESGEYALEDPRAVWTAMGIEAQLREHDPAPGSDVGRAVAELERKRLSLADRMQAFAEAPAALEESWMSPEIWATRAARYRSLAPVLRSGTLPSHGEDDAFVSRLHVTSEPSGAEVHLQALSRLDGQRLGRWPIGRTPVEAHAFHPGLLRIVVVLEGHGSAELTRDLSLPGRDYGFHARLRRDEEVRADMVRLEGGVFPFGIGTEDEWPYYGRTVELPALYVDVDEVSNAEYRRYVLETGAPHPCAWPEPYDQVWDPHPVVTVDFEMARGYAEWAGKRLPTVVEWQRIARGPQGHLYPGGDTPVDIARFAMGRPRPPLGESLESWLDNTRPAYLEFTEPVDRWTAPGEEAGPRHLYDNVSEWTESPVPMIDEDGRIHSLSGTAILMGGCWWSGEYQYTQVLEGQRDAEDFGTGFRCVKSVEP